MITVGIILGLLTALSQSVSYLFAKRFSTTRPNSRIRLLVASHLFMSVAAVILLPFLWPENLNNYDFVKPLLIATFAYLFGQGMMFIALNYTEASRISPLLVGKIVIIALIMTITGQASLNAVQWIAIAMTIIATLCITHVGGKMPLISIIGIICACTGYSISDIHIYKLMLSLHYLSEMRASLFAVTLTYLLCGLACLPLGIYRWQKTVDDLKHAAGFSTAWMLAMFLLFACISIIGPVYSSILQSARGLISIGLGAIIAMLGHHHLEKKVPPRVLTMRIIAAVILVAAIAMYKTADNRELKSEDRIDVQNAPGTQSSR